MECADHMEGRAHPSVMRHDTERSVRRGKRHLLDTEAARGGEGRHHPGGTNARTHARIVVGHGLEDTFGIVGETGPVWIGAHADRDQSQPVGDVRGNTAGALEDMRQRLQCLENRDVVGSVHGSGRAVSEVVDRRGIGLVAVELGEIGEHPPANAGTREGRPGRGNQLGGRRPGRPGGIGLVTLEVGSRQRGDGRDAPAVPLEVRGQLRQLMLGSGQIVGDDKFEVEPCVDAVEER